MPQYDFRSPRLWVADPLAPAAELTLSANQANYLRNVLRLEPGDPVLVFNGRDGEWRSVLASAGKRATTLRLEAQIRPQTPAGDLHYCFAPLKHARLDYMVQKAVELGASRLQPVLTRHTQVSRVNTDRMQANAVEAAEQCGILSLPGIGEPVSLQQWIAGREPDRLLVFCDEAAAIADPVAALRAQPPGPRALLIGPEGGFSEDERAALLRMPNTVRLALGPRILRADTAAVAALTLVQSVLGDWR